MTRYRPGRDERTLWWRRARLWYGLFLVLLVLIYWIFVRYMERIQLTPEDVPFISAPLLLNVLEFFWPTVLRHFLPVLAGAFLAYFAAVNLVWRLYDLPDHEGARGFLRRLRAPGNFLDDPILVSPQTLEEERQNTVRLRVGGPGLVKIPVGHVAVTEINGRYYRILETGTHALDRFEYIHAVLDLHRQEREDQNVKVRTSEGFTVEATVGLTYRISTGNEPVTRRRPFPYNPDAVRKLAYMQTNKGGNVTDWQGLALGKVKGELGAFMSKLKLQELIEPDGALDAQETVRMVVERKARAALRDQGIDLLRVRISRLELPPEITEQYIAQWRARGRTRAHITLADGEAVAIEEMEIAHADAELTMIQAIVEGVRRAQHEGLTDALSNMIALRFIEALEILAQRSEENAQSPEAEHLIPRLQSLQSELRHDRLLAPGTAEETHEESGEA